MAISRNMMQQELLNSGGIMGLEEPRQGYFLGKIVKKAKKAVKKITKSPIGKMALIGAGLYGLGGAQFLGGKGMFAGGQGLSRFANLKNLFLPKYTDFAGKERSGLLKSLIFDKEGAFSPGRAALTGLGAASIAAPFLMGGDEEVDEGTPFNMAQPMVEDIRSQARAYYNDPTQSALYFMPQKQFVQPSFYAADGGLASLRPGYKFGNIVQKAGQMLKAGVGKVKSLFDDADINVSVVDEDVYVPDYGYQAQATGQSVYVTPKSKKAKKVMDGLIEEGYDITKDADGDYTINALDEGALDIVAKKLKLGDKNVDEFMSGQDYFTGGDTRLMDEDSKMIYDALRNRKAEGGIMRLGYNEGESVLSKEQMAMIDDMKKKGMDMSTIESITGATADQITNYLSSLNQKQEGGLMDLGGMEKDYREGGFVPLGAEERADDVPARLSKNEFVFTADAVRNAGQGDIDKGAEVMQNMMDNLEAGGTISEESQGKNPAQGMFDQAQQLESRII